MDDTLERHLMALQFLLLGLLVITFARFVEGLSTAGFGAVDALAFIGAVVGVAGMLGAHWTGEDEEDGTEPSEGVMQGDGGSDVDTDAGDDVGELDDTVEESDDPVAVTESAEPRPEPAEDRLKQAAEPTTATPSSPALAATPRQEPVSEPGIRARQRRADVDRETKSDLIPTTEVDPVSTSRYDPVGRATIDPATRPDDDPV
ncbi:hypothetical protein [Haloarchaeobius sp. HME9146]|uniref:hypothetical protein n=1 Tax=Haloarchaeobius sp. HME9146 TaxID=2978732 RepID=UPI0021BF7B94|nr:hypothetical protein [Haloarchaeobius sp. HME9146]MCT9094983.1 hypothetical protein [Haloarchaeobius sp. HME9146]